ncbi:MAG: ABC transporter permease [Chloroflexi bacterium]|nr:ABC transporter permease [Chloroflexota bacterium]
MSDSVTGARVARKGVSQRGTLRKLYRQSRAARRAITSFVIIAILWEVIGRYVITNEALFVPFSSIGAAFTKLMSTGELQKHVQVSVTEFLLGVGVAAAVGVASGAVLAVKDTLRDYIDPVISVLYSTPTVALAPLFILGLGIGLESKAAVVFLVTVIPVIINTVAGIRATEQDFIEAARSFGASELQIFQKILIPAALPFIITGLRLGVGRGIVGVVVAELFGARAGLGLLILSTSQSFDPAGLFVAILLLAFAAVTVISILQWLEAAVAPWRKFKV